MQQTNTYHQTQGQLKAEAEIIAAAKKDPKAFQPLYDKYYNAMFRYFFKRVNTEHEAADLTSQLFVKVLQKLNQYEDRGVPFSSWLFRIAYSLVNDYFRKKKKRVITVQSDEVLDWLSTVPEVDLEKESDDNKINWLLHEIQQLKPDHIDLIEMRFFEGLSFKEIGDILDIKENTAKVRCFRITEKLFKKWNNAKKDV